MGGEYPYAAVYPKGTEPSGRDSRRRPRAGQAGRATRVAFPIPCWAMPRWRSTVKVAESWTSTDASG